MAVGELDKVLQHVTRNGGNGGLWFIIGLYGIKHKQSIELAGLPLHQMGMQRFHCGARKDRHQAA